MWYDILFILFFSVSVFSSCILFFALRRINKYENLFIQFQQIIEYSTEKMKLVDFNGHYESDDETGFFFEQLKQLQLMLNDLFEISEEKTDADEKEKR